MDICETIRLDLVYLFAYLLNILSLSVWRAFPRGGGGGGSKMESKDPAFLGSTEKLKYLPNIDCNILQAI